MLTTHVLLKKCIFMDKGSFTFHINILWRWLYICVARLGPYTRFSLASITTRIHCMHGQISAEYIRCIGMLSIFMLDRTVAPVLNLVINTLLRVVWVFCLIKGRVTWVAGCACADRKWWVVPAIRFVIDLWLLQILYKRNVQNPYFKQNYAQKATKWKN